MRIFRQIIIIMRTGACKYIYILNLQPHSTTIVGMAYIYIHICDCGRGRPLGLQLHDISISLRLFGKLSFVVYAIGHSADRELPKNVSTKLSQSICMHNVYTIMAYSIVCKVF